VRPQERGRVGFFLALGGAIALAQTVGLVAAEGLLLARLGVVALPATWLMASALTLGASLLYARRVGVERNDRVLVELLLLAVAIALALALAVTLAPARGLAYAPVALLCLQIAAQAILLGHYWELAGDYFDRLAIRRLRGLLTAGISFGAALGGAVALALAGALPPSALVAAWALLLAGVAVLIHRMRPALRRWSPLGLEDDAGSWAGVTSAARWLVRSRLGLALLLTAFAAIGATTIARLLSAETFVRAFPEERSLLRFLAVYLAVTNGIEIALPLQVVPRLVARLGVPGASLLQPLAMFMASLGLAVSPRLPAALAARASGELLENALASPVRSLIYEAVPLRFRARTSAFADGIVVYAALGVAGAALLLLHPLDRSTLAGLGVGVAVSALALQGTLRRGYDDALVAELRAGRLDLRSVGRELGRRELVRLAAVWRAGLGEAPSGDAADQGALLRPLLPLAAVLAERGLADDVRPGVEHRSPLVRAACVGALCAPDVLDETERRSILSRALDDASAEVRLAALGAVPEESSAPAAIAGRLFARLQDPDPKVRASAAARAGDLGVSVLRAGARDRDARVAVAALDRLPAALAAEAAARVGDGDPAIRAAALRFAARHPAALRLESQQLDDDLAHRDARVRRAAVRVLVAGEGPGAVPRLAQRLGDADAAVRREVVAAFGALGEAGHAAIAAALRAEPTTVARVAAYEALAAIGTPATRATLLLELRARVFEAWSSTLALHVLPRDGAPAERFLRAAESDALRSALRECFRILGQLEDPAVVLAVERTLFFGPERLRRGALEVLSHLGDRESAWRLVLLLEPGPLEAKLRDLSGFVTPLRSPADAVRRAARSPERWLRLAAARAAGALDPDKEKLMERLVFLREIPLFATLGLDQLEAIERIAREEEYVEGEEVVRQGDPGEQLYLVMEGELAVWHDWHGAAPVRLNTLGPGSYFGDIAILDRAPRSASVIVTRPSRLLVLEGMLFRELILERPEIAFEVFHVLAERLRAAEQRIAG